MSHEQRMKKDATPKTSTAAVLDAVRDLHAQEQLVTREGVAEATGLKLTVVDDRLGVLVDDGEILRIKRGVFKPAVAHPPARTMSKTILPDGWVKIEIGDEILTLTPREDRSLAQLQAGAAAQLAAIEASHHATHLHAELANRILKLERANTALREKQDAGPQMDLLQAAKA